MGGGAGIHKNKLWINYVLKGLVLIAPPSHFQGAGDLEVKVITGKNVVNHIYIVFSILYKNSGIQESEQEHNMSQEDSQT